MLKFGWSKRTISMNGPVLIIGQAHERVSKGILDENLVTALVIDDGTTVSAIVSADLIGASDGIILEIRDAMKEKCPSFPAENIMLSVTHTHTSPRYHRTTGYDHAPHDRIEFIDPEVVREFIIEQTTDAIAEAYFNRDVGSFAYGYGYAVVSHHRRPTYKDDLRLRPGNNEPTSLRLDKHAKMYGNTNDPMFMGYEGAVDSFAYFMFVFDKDERLTGAIVNVPCPSQNSEIECHLSADYWHQVRELVKREYGDITVLPLCGNAGDMAPRILHAKEAQSRKYALKYASLTFPQLIRPWEMHNRYDIAERIMDAFNETYKWASREKISDATLLHTNKTVRVDAWKITKEQYEDAKREYEYYSSLPFAETDDVYGDFKKNTTQSLAISKYRNVMERYEKDDDYYDIEMHIISLGDVAFFSNPFELYIDFQHQVQARSPFVQTFGIQLAASKNDDDVGYLCTEDAAENMGYSANIFSCNASHKGGDVIVKEALETLNEHYQRANKK